VWQDRRANLTSYRECGKMDTEKRTVVQESDDLRRFLRILWRVLKLFVIALEKEYKFKSKDE